MAADDPTPAAPDDGERAAPRFAPLDLTLRPVNREPLGSLADTGSSDLIQIRPIEWESLTTVGQDEDEKVYQTDSELQSIIEELASKIVSPEEEASRPAPKPGPAARSYGVGGIGPDVPDMPEVAESPSPATPARPAASAPPATAAVVVSAAVPVAEPAPVAEPHEPDAGFDAEPAVADAEPLIEPVVEHASETAVDVEAIGDQPQAARSGPVEPVEPVADATVQAAAVDVDGSLVDAVGGHSTSVPTIPTLPTVAAAATAATAAAPAAPAAVAAPAVPLLLPKIEPKPGATRPTRPVDFNSLLGDGPTTPIPPVRRRRRRNPFARFLKLLVFLGILAGGAYLAKIYFLDQRWPDAIAPIAEDVADQRGLEWKRAVEVEALPAGEYALRLAGSMLGVTAADTATLAVEWRAMGLAEGSVDLAAIGSAALADQPAFYDSSSETIYVVDGLSDDLREIVLTRALGNALLDQHFDWGTTVESAPGESVRLGVRGLFDGDALSLTSDSVRALIADPTRAATVTAELAALRSEAASLARGASPYAAAIAGRAGYPTRHLFSREMTPTAVAKNAAAEVPVLSDASVYDAFRGRTSAPVELTADAAAGVLPPEGGVTTAGPARSAGMIYWYYVLAGRIDAGTAWSAALAWNGDITEQALLPDGRCVSSTIATFDADGQQRMLGALQQWAATAPAEAQTTVAAGPDFTIAVRSCDPGPTADTLANESIRPFGNAEAEFVVAGDLLGVGLPQTEAARNCVIGAVRGFGLPDLVVPESIDPALIEPALDLTAQAARDLMAGCANA